MYPYTYDEITELDLAQCSIYSHTLTDGFLGDFYEFSLGSIQKIFVKYGTSENPKLDLIKYDESYILTDIASSKFNATNSYVFNLFIDDLGELSPNNVVWQDGEYMLRLYSDDSDLVYYKPIKLLREEDTTSIKQDITDIKNMIKSQGDKIQSDIDYIPSQNPGASIRM